MVEVKEDLLKIGDFSKRTGLPVSTLHFYERKGLISPERSASGHREYDENDLAWIAFIERAQIKRYADLRAKGDSTLEERMAMLVSHRESVIATISKWQENLDHLDKKIEFYEHEIKSSCK